MYPSNEKETIELFKLLMPRHGWRFVHLQQPFPDAVIEKNGEQLVAEFEYSAKNFKKHKHDPAGCDLIICYFNDWPGAPLPVWPLEGYASQYSLLLSKVIERGKSPWVERALDAERRLEDSIIKREEFKTLALEEFEKSQMLRELLGVSNDRNTEMASKFAELGKYTLKQRRDDAGFVASDTKKEAGDLEILYDVFILFRDDGFPMWTLPPIAMLLVAWCLLVGYGLGTTAFFVIISYISFIASWHLWRKRNEVQ